MSDSPYPIIDPVAPDDLATGEVYFSVGFVDDDLTMPTIEPLVFIGWNREGDEVVKTAYFQWAETYQHGVRFETTTTENPADFLIAEENELSYIFDFEGVVQSIAATALRRAQLKTRPRGRTDHDRVEGKP